MGEPRRDTSNADNRTKAQDMLCKIRYTNELPDIPFDTKFIEYKFDNERFIHYKQTSLEKYYKWDLQSDADLQLSIDLVNKDLYKIGPDQAKLHPDDEALLDEEPKERARAHRSELNSRVVPWLRRTEYLAPISTGKKRDFCDNASKPGGIRERIEQTPVFPSREEQINIIEKTFEHAQTEIENHYSKPHVHKVKEWYVLPDDEIWPYPCSQVIFDNEPVRGANDELPDLTGLKLSSEALIRATNDESDQQFMGYFLPSLDSLPNLAAECDPKESTDNKEYEFTLTREYNWNVKHPSQQGEENFFLVFKDNITTYVPFDHRIRLNKRRKTGKVAINKAKIVVQYRPLSEKEKTRQNRRSRQLSADVGARCDYNDEDGESESTEDERISEDGDPIEEKEGSNAVGKNNSQIVSE